MKKYIVTTVILAGALLAGCGDDDSAKQLETIQAQYHELEKEHEKLVTAYEKLQVDYEKAVEEETEKTQWQEEEEQKQREAEYLKKQFVQIAPKTPQGPYQVIVENPEDTTGLGSYKVEQMMLNTVPTEENNAYELAFKQLFAGLTFNEVIIHDNQTITIDFHENSIGSPNMTATGQVAPFFDMLEFFLYYNFPELKAYYLYSNGEPTYIGEGGPYTEAQPNHIPDFEHFYYRLY